MGSPVLLLSGVGGGDQLRGLGLRVIAVLPGVGENLHDHPDVTIQQACTQPVSLYRSLKPLAKLRIGLRWFLFHSGPGATNHFEAGAFIRTREGIEHPDLQLSFLPLAIDADTLQSIRSYPEDGYQTHADLLRPLSRGRLTLRTAEPADAPRILLNYLREREDRDGLRRAVKLVREVHAQGAFAPFRGRELAPGAAVRTDDEIDAWVRATAETAYHPVGTCKMGPEGGPMAVVDPLCKVYGVEGLRVVDASVMPSIVSGNTNAPTIMIAEKASDMIARVE